MQVVRDKLVIPLQVVVGDVEEQCPIQRFDAVAQYAEGLLVTLQQRRQQWRYQRRDHDLGERLARKQRDQTWKKLGILSGLDHHRKLHGGCFHFDSSLGIGIQGAINNVGPVHELSDRRRVESKTLFCNRGDETGAGLEIRIIELAVAWVLFEVFSIRRTQKGALVMIKPPCDFWRTRILEIHDGILISVEIVVVE